MMFIISRGKPICFYIGSLLTCALLCSSGLLFAEPDRRTSTAGFWYGHGHAKASKGAHSGMTTDFEYDTDFWFDVDDSGRIEGYAAMRCAVRLDDHKLRNLIKLGTKLSGALPSSDALPAPTALLPLPAGAPALTGPSGAPSLPQSSWDQIGSMLHTVLSADIVGLRLNYDDKMPIILGKIKGNVIKDQMILNWETPPPGVPFTLLRENLTDEPKMAGGQVRSVNPWSKKPAWIQAANGGMAALGHGDDGELAWYWTAVRAQLRRPEPAEPDADRALWRPPTTGSWVGTGHARALQKPAKETVTNWDVDTDFWFNVNADGRVDGFAVMRCAISLDDHRLRDLIKWALDQAGAIQKGVLQGSLAPIGPLLQAAASPNVKGLRLNYDGKMPVAEGEITGELAEGKLTLKWKKNPAGIPYTIRREELTEEPKIGGGKAPPVNPWAKAAGIQTLKNGVAALASGDNGQLALYWSAVRVQPLCPSYILGESDGGPGVWGPVSRGEKGAFYQEEITGAPRGIEYLVPRGYKPTNKSPWFVAFDGYDCRRNVLLDAKDLESVSKRKAEEYKEEAEYQRAAANGTPVEWVVPCPSAEYGLNKFLLPILTPSDEPLADFKVALKKGGLAECKPF